VPILLISTYDLGRQPFGIASPAAWLRRAGLDVITRDVSREPLHDDDDVVAATRVAVYLPMHTATRLALPVIDRIRAVRPELELCAYGLYAPLNADLLRERGVQTILGPEAEADLVDWATGAGSRGVSASAAPTNTAPRTRTPASVVDRLQFITPDRSTLPDLTRYATLQMPDGSRRTAGATEATRGCKHRCRHCPIVPVYDGQFRVVGVDVVMADIDQQVGGGAQHITFGDPDFFNGPTHARRIVEALHARHPAITYDVTIKVEHLLRHRELLPVLARTGCVFVTSAVESVDDEILRRFEKNHTRADFEQAVQLMRDAGLVLAPTFVAFTPWTSLEGYRGLLDSVDRLDLVEHVALVQWALRLLITQGSRLLELDDIRARVGAFDRQSLTYPWQHDDPRMDDLQRMIAKFVGVRINRSRREVFEEIRVLAGGAAEDARPLLARAAIPYLNEPWYC
jgi:radical SAM superfamily enzyme YgiQ (UPF0313 family)